VLLIDAGVSPAKGTRATDLEAGKKTLGPMGAGAVRLAEPGQVLGIAEGVETALSAAQLFRCPVWAALGAHRLGSIFLPSSVKKVVIFGDLGPAGEKAAAAAVIAYRRRGYTAESVFPDLYADFNEMLMAR
jgi:DNA primase